MSDHVGLRVSFFGVMTRGTSRVCGIARIGGLSILFLFISCSQNKSVIEVIYTINEFSSEDNRLNVTLDITNKTNNDISSLWSLHWNQISALVDSESIPKNEKHISFFCYILRCKSINFFSSSYKLLSNVIFPFYLLDT